MKGFSLCVQGGWLMMVTAQQASITLRLLAGRLAAPLCCWQQVKSHDFTDADWHRPPSRGGVFSVLWVQVETIGGDRGGETGEKIHHDAVFIFRVLLYWACSLFPLFLSLLIIKAFPINFQIKVRMGKGMLRPRGQLVTNATKPVSPPHPLLISHDGVEGGVKGTLLKEGLTLIVFVGSAFTQKASSWKHNRVLWWCVLNPQIKAMRWCWGGCARVFVLDVWAEQMEKTKPAQRDAAYIS